MNIGIDARMYGLENAGIGRYVINLVQGMYKLDKSNQYTLFLRSKYARTLKVPKNFKKVTANYKHYSLDEQLKFPKIIEKHAVELMHFPHFNVPLLYNKPFIVTIHDLLWHKTKGLSVTSLPPIKYLLKYFGYKAVVNHAILKSSAILVPSDFVKDDVIKYGGDKDKIIVTYEGVDKKLKDQKPASFSVLSKKFKLNNPFIIYTGSAYPHKNLKIIIDAVQLYHAKYKDDIKLIIISSRNIFLDKLKKYVSNKKLGKLVIFAGYLPDNAVKSLYKKAIALVHPSLSEGFGLTGLEAMSVGLPVISSKEGSLPEIYDEAAVYINPHNAQEICDSINLLMKNDSKRKQLIEAGYKRSSLFLWKDTVLKTKQTYDKIYKENV